MAGGAKDDRGVARRLLDVLAAFERDDAPALTLTQIADRASLPMATAHRIVRELTDWGALEHTSDGAIRLGRRLWRLGTRYPPARTLRQVALPFLEDLLALTRQNVQIAIRDGLAALYVERLTSRDSVDVIADVGRRLPLHSTGVGLVLLAHGPADLLDQVVAAGPKRYLEATMTTAAELRPRLDRIRREGIALTRDEMTLGSASIAAPVRDAKGSVVAALSIIIPSSQQPEPRYELAVRLAATGISRALGWSP